VTRSTRHPRQRLSARLKRGTQYTEITPLTSWRQPQESGWCRRGCGSVSRVLNVSCVLRSNIFQYPRLATPPARAPWTVAASRPVMYTKRRAVGVLLKFRVNPSRNGARTPEIELRGVASQGVGGNSQYDASPTTQPQIMDTKGAIARRKRSSCKRCVYPMSQHHSRAQRSPCGRLHLASSLHFAGKLRLLRRRSSSTNFGERS
jgi:hypothetical protein